MYNVQVNLPPWASVHQGGLPSSVPSGHVGQGLACQPDHGSARSTACSSKPNPAAHWQPFVAHDSQPAHEPASSFIPGDAAGQASQAGTSNTARPAHDPHPWQGPTLHEHAPIVNDGVPFWPSLQGPGLMSKHGGRPHADQDGAAVPLHDPHAPKQSPWSKLQHPGQPLAAAALSQRQQSPSAAARPSGLEQLSSPGMQQSSMPVSKALHSQGWSTLSPSAGSAPFSCAEHIDTILDSSNDWLIESLESAPDLMALPSLDPIEGFNTNDAFDFSLPGTEGFCADDLLDMLLSETDDTEGDDIFQSTSSCLSGSIRQPVLQSPTPGLPPSSVDSNLALQPEQPVHTAQHQQANTAVLAANNNVHRPDSPCSTPAQPCTPPVALPTAGTQPDSVTRYPPQQVLQGGAGVSSTRDALTPAAVQGRPEAAAGIDCVQLLGASMPEPHDGRPCHHTAPALANAQHAGLTPGSPHGCSGTALHSTDKHRMQGIPQRRLTATPCWSITRGGGPGSSNDHPNSAEAPCIPQTRDGANISCGPMAPGKESLAESVQNAMPGSTSCSGSMQQMQHRDLQHQPRLAALRPMMGQQDSQLLQLLASLARPATRGCRHHASHGCVGIIGCYIIAVFIP